LKSFHEDLHLVHFELRTQFEKMSLFRFN
jgi:hypothetical protein